MHAPQLFEELKYNNRESGLQNNGCALFDSRAHVRISLQALL